MFSDLDNFLNGASSFKAQQNDLPDDSFTNINDSWDLDLSAPTTSKKKTKKDSDDEDDIGKFVPGKGQKTVVKRLEKIKGKMQDEMEQIKRIKDQTDRNTAKALKAAKKTASKKKSPRKRGRRGVVYESETSEDDDDELLTNYVRPNRPVHDPNTIVLDCDDEFIGGPAVNLTRNLATASTLIAEEYMDLKVNIKINGKIEQFQSNAYQKLSTIIAKISTEKNIDADNIALMYKDKMVSEQDTFDSIGYIQGMVIKAHISDTLNKNENTVASASNTNSNKLEIKIQTENRKRPFITHIGATDKLITLAFSCAEEFKCDLDKVAIEFDGEFINFQETAEDLGLEGGEVMDFFLKK